MNDLPVPRPCAVFITVGAKALFTRRQFAESHPAAVSLQLKGLEESTGLLFSPDSGGFTLTEAGCGLAAAGAQGGMAATSDFTDDGETSLKVDAGVASRSATILDPESSGLAPFVRSLATSLKKTEVFLRWA